MNDYKSDIAHKMDRIQVKEICNILNKEYGDDVEFIFKKYGEKWFISYDREYYNNEINVLSLDLVKKYDYLKLQNGTELQIVCSKDSQR